jgi:aminoglycoside 6'-N-acetyltransferase
VDDLSRLYEWTCRPHVKPWWDPPATFAEFEAEYAKDAREHNATFIYFVLLDGRPVAMIQWYHWSSYEAEVEQEDGDIGLLPGEAGVDYLIAEPGLVGQGFGPRMIGKFIAEYVFTDPTVTGIRTTVHAENRRSWRALEKLGFTRGDPFPHPKGNLQYAPHVTREDFRQFSAP